MRSMPSLALGPGFRSGTTASQVRSAGLPLRRRFASALPRYRGGYPQPDMGRQVVLLVFE
jgi:hypothetical protein